MMLQCSGVVAEGTRETIAPCPLNFGQFKNCQKIFLSEENYPKMLNFKPRTHFGNILGKNWNFEHL